MPDTDSGQALLESVRRSLRWLTAATVVLYVGLVVAGYEIYSGSRENTDALCALRADLESRIESSLKFLVDHPNGVGGISAKVIRVGVTNEQQTVRALRGLSCGDSRA